MFISSAEIDAVVKQVSLSQMYHEFLALCEKAKEQARKPHLVNIITTWQKAGTESFTIHSEFGLSFAHKRIKDIFETEILVSK